METYLTDKYFSVREFFNVRILRVDLGQVFKFFCTNLYDIGFQIRCNACRW